jgi:glycosyltransferase involved in cell wall biosynthesis
MKKDLIWFGPPFSYSGYAQHNRAMLFELNKLGWNIKLVPSENHIPAGLIGKDILLKMVNNETVKKEDSICLNLIPPPALMFKSCYTILFTTMESRTVHEGFMTRSKQYDEVIVPCWDNFISLSKAGYPSKKLSVCPEGVYSEYLNPFTQPHPKYYSDKFTFFFHGDWSFRKGIDILIRAYAQAFNENDNVRLLMLTHYQGNDKSVSQDRIPAELRGLCKQYGIAKLPRIDFIFDYIPDDELPSVYNCTDVYACPTRGEAWCLPVIQAMSCARPAIYTDWGGQTDFCNKGNGWPCKLEKFDIMDDKCNLVVDFYKGQEFAFCDVNQFAKLMRYTYDNKEEVKKKGTQARKDCIKKWSWENAGKIIDRHLRGIYESHAYASNLRSYRDTETMYNDVVKGYTARYF